MMKLIGMLKKLTKFQWFFVFNYSHFFLTPAALTTAEQTIGMAEPLLVYRPAGLGIKGQFAMGTNAV